MRTRKAKAAAAADVTTPKLRALALDIVEGKVFGSWQIDTKDLHHHFMCLLFLKKEDTPKDIGAIYEYFDDRVSSIAINGKPVFASCRFLTQEEFRQVIAFVEEARAHRNKFLNNEPETNSAGPTQPADSKQQLDSRRGASRSDRDSGGSESSDDATSARISRLLKRKSGSTGLPKKPRAGLESKRTKG